MDQYLQINPFSVSQLQCVFLHSTRVVGAEWDAHHRSCREELLWCLCVRGQQPRGSEGEQGGAPLRAGWDHVPVAAYYYNCSNNITLELGSMLWMQRASQHSRPLLFSSTAAKPLLVLKPQNVSVQMGESAQFYCEAKGDPPPAVVWSREQGPLPNGRYFITALRRRHTPVRRNFSDAISRFVFRSLMCRKQHFVIHTAPYFSSSCEKFKKGIETSVRRHWNW